MNRDKRDNRELMTTGTNNPVEFSIAKGLTKNILLFSFLFILAAAFTGCGEDDPNGEVDQSGIVTIIDDIYGVTTWYADSLYVIDQWIYVYNTLQIEPGTIIKFKDDEGSIYLGDGGTIIADASRDEPIIFTSYKDDEHGGDTNGDDDILSPAVKDWGEVATEGYNGSIFNYCEFYYGGNSTYSSTLTVNGRNIEVTNCKFVYNSGDDGSGDYGALDAYNGGSGCIITGNQFYNNVRPLSISMEYDLDNSNHFHNPADPSQINEYNGIFVYCGDQKGTISWLETEVPYVMDGNNYIDTETTLSLANSVCLKFRADAYMQVYSSANLVNHDGGGVIFSSYKDDTLKGDTNGDGDITLPGAGDWEGIYSDDLGVYYNWTNILYAAN